MAKKVLFVAAHPDDETLGCGGAILRHKAMGDEIFWLIVTCAYEKDGFSRQEIENRKNELAKVSGKYGFDKVFELKLPTTLLDAMPMREVVDAVKPVVSDLQPRIVYMPYRGDVHTDHRVVSDAVWGLTKSFRAPFVKEVYAYETLSETEFSFPGPDNNFVANTFYDITDFLDQKIEIMRIYESELKPHPFPRSETNIRALAALRGAIAGVKYAEAFLCLKRIV